MKKIILTLFSLLFPLIALAADYGDHGRDYSVDDGDSGWLETIIGLIIFVLLIIFSSNSSK